MKAKVMGTCVLVLIDGLWVLVVMLLSLRSLKPGGEADAAMSASLQA